VLATTAAPQHWRQNYETITDALFCLPEFLSPAHYPAFVSYYLQSRQIDLILLSDSREGRCMLPWLRQHFPDIPIADCSLAGSDCDIPGVAEALRIGPAFTQDLERLLTDETRKPERNRASQTLQQCAPMAAERYTSEMRVLLLENTPIDANTHTSLLHKTLHSLREDGLKGFAVRAAAWLRRKKDSLLRHLHL